MTSHKGKTLMKIIGLTGGIGMGKSTVAKILKEAGFPVYSADAAVHELLKKGGAAVMQVARFFPEALKRGKIDRKVLSASVFGRPDKLRKLEQIIHPKLRKAERAFLLKAQKDGSHAAILEIPLLFETGANARCDVVLCVSSPLKIQKARVMARPHMTEEKLKAILSRQMKNGERRKKADFVIDTVGSLEATQLSVHKILDKLSLQQGETLSLKPKMR